MLRGTFVASGHLLRFNLILSTMEEPPAHALAAVEELQRLGPQEQRTLLQSAVRGDDLRSEIQVRASLATKGFLSTTPFAVDEFQSFSCRWSSQADVVLGAPVRDIYLHCLHVEEHQQPCSMCAPELHY